jgi:hypothetical protein
MLQATIFAFHLIHASLRKVSEIYTDVFRNHSWSFLRICEFVQRTRGDPQACGSPRLVLLLRSRGDPQAFVHQVEGEVSSKKSI